MTVTVCTGSDQCDSVECGRVLVYGAVSVVTECDRVCIYRFGSVVIQLSVTVSVCTGLYQW